MILNLNGPIDSNMFSTLCEAVNICIEKNEPLRIYFCSEGGDAGIMEAIIALINECHEFIELVGYNVLFSAGFIIFFSVKCQKSLLPLTNGMMHHAYISVTLDGRGKHKPDQSNEYYVKSILETKTIFTKFIKTLDLTPQEEKDLADGKDVYFLNKRMLELLNGKQSNSKRASKVRGKSGGVSALPEGEHNSNESK